jgi:hypothetical protein
MGTTSAYGWTTFPAEKQIAAIEMRAGQNGGPLPFEESFEFGDTIINRALATAKRWIRRLRGKRKGVFCNKGYVIRKSWNILLDEEIIFLEEINFLGKENQEGGTNNLVFQSRGISIHSKGNGQIDGRATFGWVSVARDRRREQAKLQPTATLRFRAERLSAGLGNIRRPSVASSTAANVATSAPKVIMMDEFEMRDEVKPAPASRLRAEGLWAGEAQVEAERDEVTLPAEELRKATTL